MQLIAEGLGFPEAPVVLGDELLVSEIAGACITKVNGDGEKHVVCETGGGPNGVAVGPDGLLYVCNNGGLDFSLKSGVNEPVGLAAASIGGRIQRVNCQTGVVQDLYTAFDGKPMACPNDLVFDGVGNFYFTDTLLGSVFVADPSGGRIRRVASALQMPNGIGLSPDGATLYVAETYSGSLIAFDVGARSSLSGQREIYSSGGAHGFDSLAVDSEGSICVANLGQSAITILRPEGTVLATVPMPEADPYVTNICFGGEGLATAYVTSGGRGRVYATTWHCPGQPLHWA